MSEYDGALIDLDELHPLHVLCSTSPKAYVCIRVTRSASGDPRLEVFAPASQSESDAQGTSDRLVRSSIVSFKMIADDLSRNPRTPAAYRLSDDWPLLFLIVEKDWKAARLAIRLMTGWVARPCDHPH